MKLQSIVHAKSSGGILGTDSSASVVQRRTEGKADELYPMMPQRWQVAFSLTILEFLHSLARFNILAIIVLILYLSICIYIIIPKWAHLYQKIFYV
jgi:hypothetical protein